MTPEGFKLVGKGRRKGLEITWESLTSGEAALAMALQASVNPKLNLEPGLAAKTEGKGGGKQIAAFRIVKDRRVERARPGSRPKPR